MYFYDLELATFWGLSRENRDERDLCSCRTITVSSLSYDDSIYVADCCTTEMHKVNTLHAQYTTLIECGIVVTCRITSLLYKANGVKEPVVSSHGLLILLCATQKH